MSNTDKVTADTITGDQIDALKAESIEADDYLQVDLCKIAVGIPVTDSPFWNLSPSAARQRCADAINAARAKAGS